MYIYKPTTCFKAHGGSRALALTPRAATLAPVSSHQHNEQMRSRARYLAQTTQLARDLVVFLWLFFVVQVCCCCCVRVDCLFFVVYCGVCVLMLLVCVSDFSFACFIVLRSSSLYCLGFIFIGILILDVFHCVLGHRQVATIPSVCRHVCAQPYVHTCLYVSR
jgi:hypothetical protein